MAVKLFLLVLALTAAEALRILVVFPVPAKSHNILGYGVAKVLHDAGHEVVHVTSFPSTNLPPRMREIDVSSVHEELKKEQSEEYDQYNLRHLIASKVNFGDNLDFFLMVHNLHKGFLEHPNVMELLSDPAENFDVAILEWFFSESLAGIPAILKCPLIWLGTTEGHGSILRLIDEISNPAYNADLFSSIRPPFTFLERGHELWTVVKRQWTINYHIIPLEQKLYNAVYSKIAAKRGVSIPEYEEAVYNASFMFLNSHPSIGTPYRLPQNVKYVAGYHIDDERKPLPADLQKLLDESKHGVIYFSMGSNLQSNDMTTEMKESLLVTFGKLKQIVLWKFEGELEGIPENVRLLKWAPQQSILAHPNLKFFITHGGQLSTTEAIHFGVPVIGLPVYGDQYVNMRAVALKGFGIMVEMREGVSEELGEAIDIMLNDPTYTVAAKRLSSIYHHRPVTAAAEIVHWTEHVVNTQGAPHLRSTSLLLPWYQKLYLDYLALLIIGTILIVSNIKSCLFGRKRLRVDRRRKNK